MGGCFGRRRGRNRVGGLMSALPSGCPAWNYDDVPGYRGVLRVRHATLLENMRQQKVNAREAGADCRPVHRDFFGDLAPTICKYYAGNYRGSAFHCLRNYPVTVDADRRVGAAPGEVPSSMARLGLRIIKAISRLDASRSPSAWPKTEEQRLGDLVEVVSMVFQQFLTVHPFVDGNGHMGRFLVSLLLQRYGYATTPEHWRIDPNPRIPHYSEAISAHRDGNTEPLQMMILAAVIRPSPTPIDDPEAVN